KDVTVTIAGMTCSACSTRVEKVLNRQDGVDASVNLTTERATIQYDPDVVSVEDITSTIERLGYGVEVEKVEFDITGMTCSACSSRVEKVLRNQVGVKSASVNLATESAVIEYQAGVIDEESLIATIENLGYGAKAKGDRADKESVKDKEIRNMQIKLI